MNDFRWKMKLLGTEVARNRQNKSWLEKVAYQFPPRLASSFTIPASCLARLREGSYFVIDSRFQNTEVPTYFLNKIVLSISNHNPFNKILFIAL